jgi:phage terminase small subunit
MARLPDQNMKAGPPVKPDTLSPRASAEWDRLVGELDKAGILISPAHRSLLSTAATLAADIWDAWEAVKKDGAYIQGKSGLQAHPATKRIDALRRDRIKVLSLLGLRSAVAGEDSGETLEDILNG